jgi:hypothetical protein
VVGLSRTIQGMEVQFLEPILVEFMSESRDGELERIQAE